MKSRLYEGLSEQDVKNNLELDNVGVIEKHEFVRQFEEQELIEYERKHITAAKELNILEAELKRITEPLNEKIKELKTTMRKTIAIINQGGEEVFEKVYCFPDYENSLVGLYDQKGRLVGTRPMTRNERQMHINSFKNIASGQDYIVKRVDNL